ncbi:H-2 class II histocompatibility antigen, E-S beta chain isoform X1, partial [Silurus meridionalis]
GHFLAFPIQCIWSKEDMSDMEYIRPQVFNKIKFLEYNSTLGKFIGYTELGVRNAERANKDTALLQSLKAEVERYCKGNAQLYYTAIFSKT